MGQISVRNRGTVASLPPLPLGCPTPEGDAMTDTDSEGRFASPEERRQLMMLLTADGPDWLMDSIGREDATDMCIQSLAAETLGQGLRQIEMGDQLARSFARSGRSCPTRPRRDDGVRRGVGTARGGELADMELDERLHRHEGGQLRQPRDRVTGTTRPQRIQAPSLEEVAARSTSGLRAAAPHQGRSDRHRRSDEPKLTSVNQAGGAMPRLRRVGWAGQAGHATVNGVLIARFVWDMERRECGPVPWRRWAARSGP